MENFTYNSLQEKLLQYIETEVSETQLSIENCFKNFDFTKFANKLQFSNEQLSKAKNLNSLHTPQELQQFNGKFVKYHCMIQNISEPEICIGFTKKLASNANTTINDWQILVYNEDLQFNEQDYENLEKNGIMIERFPMCCVPVPGINDWVKNIDNECNMSIEENEEVKKQDYSCLVKLYADPNQTLNLRLNEEVIFYGILYYSSAKIQQEQQSEELECLSCDQIYPIADYPRLHCLYFEKLTTDQVLIRQNFMPLQEQITPEFASINYQIIKSFLNQLFNNNEIATHYIFLAIISQIYQKHDEDFLGKMILNLSNVHKQTCTIMYENTCVYKGTLPQILTFVISKMVQKSQFLDLTLKNLCEQNFQAWKNFNTQKLEQGHLQLTPKTFLLINETSMDAGTLNQKGIENVAALNNILEVQKSTLNFTYQNIYLETNIQAIIFSEGKSFLQHDIQVKLENNQADIITIDKTFYETIFAVEPNKQTLFSLRKYLMLVSNEIPKVTLEQAVCKFIEDDFLQERKKQEQNKSAQKADSITHKTLHQWISQSKALSAAKGLQKIDKNLFKEVKQLDKQRVSKIYQTN